jgi:hypothetical protein
MNPSSSGWIKKFGSLAMTQTASYTDAVLWYEDMAHWGLVYGIPWDVPMGLDLPHQPTADERCKVLMIYGFWTSYHWIHPQHNFDQMVVALIEFYTVLGQDKKTILGRLGFPNDPYGQLEATLESRLFPNQGFVLGALGQSVINIWLFQDVLAWIAYLQGEKNTLAFRKQLEINCFGLLQQLMGNSGVWEKIKPQLIHGTQWITKELLLGQELPESPISVRSEHPLNARYMVDFCLFAYLTQVKKTPWGTVETWGQQVDIDPTYLSERYNAQVTWLEEHRAFIDHGWEGLFGVQFYDRVKEWTQKLILRNSKRLIKELEGSGELLVLLSKSTHKELNPKEKKKVQEQLLDIFKSIPSLAIFLLPGGALLLPMVVKLIPKLLPSAFDENRIDKDPNG